MKKKKNPCRSEILRLRLTPALSNGETLLGLMRITSPTEISLHFFILIFNGTRSLAHFFPRDRKQYILVSVLSSSRSHTISSLPYFALTTRGSVFSKGVCKRRNNKLPSGPLLRQDPSLCIKSCF